MIFKKLFNFFKVSAKTPLNIFNNSFIDFLRRI